MPVSSKGLYGSALLSSAILLGFTVAHAQQMGPPSGRMGPGMHQGQGITHEGMMGRCGQDHGHDAWPGARRPSRLRQG